MLLDSSFSTLAYQSSCESLSQFSSGIGLETPRYLETAIVVVGLRDGSLLSILCNFLNRLPGCQQRQRVVLLTALYYADRDVGLLEWMLQSSTMMQSSLEPWFKHHLKKFFHTLEFTPEGGQRLIHGSTSAELQLLQSLLKFRNPQPRFAYKTAP